MQTTNAHSFTEHLSEFYHYLDTSDDTKYFCTLQEVADFVEGIVGHRLEASFNCIKDALRRYTEKYKDDDVRYDLYEIKVCDN